MGECPILFSGEMVRAILAGRKTQTRRPVAVRWRSDDDPGQRIRPAFSAGGWATVWDNGDHAIFATWDKHGVGGENGRERTVEDAKGWAVKCAHRQKLMASPFGVPGDTLWVRETWRTSASDERHALYAADVSAYERDEKGPWRPSIHMPRWASRLTLRVTDVRAERVQDLTEEDAVAEGCTSTVLAQGVAADEMETAREQFERLWASVYGADSWSANPWVWVVAFERAEEVGRG